MQYFNLEECLKNKYKREKFRLDLIINGFNNILNKLNIDINDLEYLSEGESSIAFQYEDKVIKLSFVSYKGYSMTDYVSYSSYIEPVLYEEAIDIESFYKMYVIINKKLDCNDITEKDVFTLYSLLRMDGYLWDDTKISNVGRDEKGCLKLLDYGELINLNVLNQSEINRYLKMHLSYKKEYDEYYNKMINGYFERITLKEKISNVFKTKKKLIFMKNMIY